MANHNGISKTAARAVLREMRAQMEKMVAEASQHPTVYDANRIIAHAWCSLEGALGAIGECRDDAAIYKLAQPFDDPKKAE